MQDLVQQYNPLTLFGSLMALLILYVGFHINDITMMVVSLGEVESHLQQKAIWAVTLKSFCFLVKQRPCVGDHNTNMVRSFKAWSRSHKNR